MSTRQTQKIIDDTVKTPKEFLHLCLINLGICVSTGDIPFDTSQENYTEYIKKSYQDLISHHTRALKNAKAKYERVINLSDDDLYEMYVKKFTDDRNYFQERIEGVKKKNAKYQLFYDAIKNWDCSEEFDNIKRFALNQIKISRELVVDYKDELSKKMLTKKEFISNDKSKYKEGLLKNTEWEISYHQERIDAITKNMNIALTFYERFKKEIEKL